MLGVRLSEIDESVLARLIESKYQESDQLDFKTSWTVSKDADEFRKDVCALANARGGLIIYGIKDDKSVAVELTPISPVGELRDQVASILHSGCRPVPRFEMEEVPSIREPGKVYVLVVVPQSGDGPHARLQDSKKGKWLNFPVRFETTTVFLNENELAERYRRRFQLLRDRAQRMTELQGSFSDDDGKQTSLVLVRFCAVPSAPGEAAINSALIDRWKARLRDLWAGDILFGLGDILSWLWPPFEAGDHGFRRRAVRIGSRFTYFDFHSDGSTVAQRAFLNLVETSVDEPTPVCIDQQGLAVWIAALHATASAFAVEEAAASGDLTMQVRLIGTRPPHGTPPPVAFSRGHAEFPTVIWGGHGSTEVFSESSVPVELLCGSPTPQMIGAWRSCMDELANCIGLPGSDLFEGSGLAYANWSEANKVREWSSRWNLEV